MKRLLGISVLVFTAVLATPTHAIADEVRILHGTLRQRLSANGDLHIQGTSGLRIDASLSFAFGSFGWRRCELAPVCLPGEVVSLRSDYLGDPFFGGSGQVTIQGKTYSLFNEAIANLHFDGAVVLPAFIDFQPVEVFAPFAFSGSLQLPNMPEPVDLHGSGVATVLLVRSVFHMGWVVVSVTYDFVPRGNPIQP